MPDDMYRVPGSCLNFPGDSLLYVLSTTKYIYENKFAKEMIWLRQMNVV